MTGPGRTLVLLLALGLPSLAFAQQVPPAIASSTPQERALVQTAVMKEKLGLGKEQLPKVEAINLQTAQQMEPVLKGNDRPLMKVRAAKAAEDQRDAALQGVLTPLQLQQFQAMREEIKQKAEQRLIEKKTGGGAP